MIPRAPKWQRPVSSITYEYCKRVAAQCKHRTEMQQTDQTAYKKALIEGWLDEFFPVHYYLVKGKKTRVRARDLTVKSKFGPVVELFNKINEEKIPLIELAKLSGVSTKTINKWRQGESAPMLKEFMYVVWALGYKLELTKETPNDTARLRDRHTHLIVT